MRHGSVVPYRPEWLLRDGPKSSAHHTGATSIRSLHKITMARHPQTMLPMRRPGNGRRTGIPTLQLERRLAKRESRNSAKITQRPMWWLRQENTALNHRYAATQVLRPRRKRASEHTAALHTHKSPGECTAQGRTQECVQVVYPSTENDINTDDGAQQAQDGGQSITQVIVPDS
jgi:hypothetical protein